MEEIEKMKHYIEKLEGKVETNIGIFNIVTSDENEQTRKKQKYY